MFNKVLSYSLNSWRYRQLFWSIIVLFLFASFVTSSVGGIITTFLLTFTIFLMLRAVAIADHWRKFLQGLVIVALGFSLSNFLIEDSLISQYFSSFADLIYAIYLACIIVILAKQLNQSKQVNSDTLTGAICVYLLTGIFWFLLYRISFEIYPGNFTKLLEDHNLIDFRLLYFSFTTLTTLGYGDITPTGSAAMGLANLEAIVGQMYPAIFVARLVSLYTVNFKSD